MDLLHPLCAGLDVHKDTVVACLRRVVDGRVKREVRTFGTTTRDLLELSDWLASQGCRHVTMEATGVYWKPVWHILSDGDVELVLANARHVKNVPGRKSDVSDAAWQSDLLAHGLIRASFVPDGATQELRGLLRTRKQLVQERTRHIQRLQKTLEDAKHQARLDHLRPARPQRSRDDRGAHRRRDRSGQAGRSGRWADQGLDLHGRCLGAVAAVIERSGPPRVETYNPDMLIGCARADDQNPSRTG